MFKRVVFALLRCLPLLLLLLFIWLTGILNDIPTFRLNEQIDTRQFAQKSPAGHVLGLTGRIMVLCLLLVDTTSIGVIACTASMSLTASISKWRSMPSKVQRLCNARTILLYANIEIKFVCDISGTRSYLASKTWHYPHLSSRAALPRVRSQ